MKEALVRGRHIKRHLGDFGLHNVNFIKSYTQILDLTIVSITSSTSRIWIWSPFWISITLEVWKVTAKHRLDMAKNVSKMTILWKVLKLPEMIQVDPRWVQKGSGSFSDHLELHKKGPNLKTWQLPKNPARSHMNLQNHPQIHKSLVLAHNIHKECPLGVASISIIIYDS